MAGTISIPLIVKSPNKSTITYGKGRFDAIDYTAGGVTWDLTPCNFVSVPQVFVTVVLKNLAFSATTTLTVVVTSVTASQAVIRVLKNDGTTIAEVAADDVTLHLFVIGD